MIIYDTAVFLVFLLLFVIFYFLIFKRRSKVHSVQPTYEKEIVPEPIEEEPEEEKEAPEEEEPEEEVLPEAVEEKTEESGKKGQRRAPIDSGGRPRGAIEKGEEIVPRSIQRQWRPEIVCWQRGRLWYVGLEVPEELMEKDLEILQNNTYLPQDEYNDCCWVLNKVNIPVKIRWDENEEYQIPLGEEDYLIFRLSGGDQDKGCCIKTPSFGSYFLITPETWEREIELSGSPPVSTQPVSLEGYRGHFFNLVKGDDRKIAFRNENKELRLIESKATRFEVVGNLINDSSEKYGPLFGDGPIKIQSLNNHGWSDVGTLIIGEEGGGKGKWRIDFNPVENELIQELPSKLMSRQGGWYFIRFYDLNDELIESIDFRFVSGLRELKTLQASTVPSADGHSIAYVEFTHDSYINIKPKVALKEGIEISHEVNTTTLEIPPRDIFDETSWIVGPTKGPQVEVNILLKRVWWGIGNEDEPPFEWKDKPISLSREYFAPTSKKAIYLKFPRPRWITDTILIGFEKSRAQSFNVRVDERVLVIPLRNFGDNIEVENEDQGALFSIWISCGNEKHECTVALLPSNIQKELDEGLQALEPYCIGYGRKRRAVAKAILVKGPPKIEVNGQPLWHYFEPAPLKAKRFLRRLLQFEEVSKTLLDFQIIIIVIGSSPDTMQQAKAATHALARALMKLDPDLNQILKRLNDFGGVRVEGLPKNKGVGL